MKKYKDKEVAAVYCNCCGKEIKVEHGIVKEGIFMAEIAWGYFSEKDGELHNFDLCEKCYDVITERFSIPVERRNLREFL